MFTLLLLVFVSFSSVFLPVLGKDRYLYNLKFPLSFIICHCWALNCCACVNCYVCALCSWLM